MELVRNAFSCAKQTVWSLELQSYLAVMARYSTLGNQKIPVTLWFHVDRLISEKWSCLFSALLCDYILPYAGDLCACRSCFWINISYCLFWVFCLGYHMLLESKASMLFTVNWNMNGMYSGISFSKKRMKIWDHHNVSYWIVRSVPVSPLIIIFLNLYPELSLE